MSCRCSELAEDKKKTTEYSRIFSEIEDTGQPYKTIEAIINNNRMILRIQKLAVEEAEEWEPSCDCLQQSSAKQLETKYSDSQPSHIVMSSASSKNPTSFFLSPKSRNEQLENSSSNEIIENPNVFLLKIRKRSETWDKKKENIDLEFRAPRPWPKPIPKKPKIVSKITLESKQSEIIEVEKELIPPKEKTTKKKKKGKKRKKEKKGKKKKK